MVLETRLKYIIVTILFVFNIGCSADTEIYSDQAMINQHALSLVDIDGACFLRVTNNNSASHRLRITPPCYFVRNHKQELVKYNYPDIGVNAVVMIIGDPASDKKKNKWGVDKTTFCGEGREAIVFGKDGYKISEKILRGGLICKNKGADEKDFWFFVH